MYTKNYRQYQLHNSNGHNNNNNDNNNKYEIVIGHKEMKGIWILNGICVFIRMH